MSNDNIDLNNAIDHDGDGSPRPIAKEVRSNGLSRATEVSRFSGAPAQLPYLAADFGRPTTSLQVTADVQVSSVIGNGAGLIGGLVLHYFAQDYYRTGSHQFVEMASDPMDGKFSDLPVTADAAFIRWGNKLYYINNVTKKRSLLKIDEKDFESAFKKVKVGTSLFLPSNSKKLKELSSKVPNLTLCTGRTSTNPLYRNFKTLANFGWQVGATISNFLGIEDPLKKKILSCILSDLCCFLFGLIALPYWLIREKILKIDPGSKHRYAVTGNEGWSKYLRTLLAFGIAVGQAIGGLFATLVANASSAAASFSIAFWGGLVGVITFIVGLIAVPLINWLTSRAHDLHLVSSDEEISVAKFPKKGVILKKHGKQIKAYFLKGGKVDYPMDLRLTAEEIKQLNFPTEKGKSTVIKNTDKPVLVDAVTSQCSLGLLVSDDKNYIRNNYTRSGMTLGAGLFALLGLLVGNWVFGIVLAGIIFSAIGSVIGGVVFSLTSHKLHRKMHTIPQGYKLCLLDKEKKEEDIKAENIPDEGKRTIILRKEGEQVKAYFIKNKKITSPINLRLTAEEINQLHFPENGQAPLVINHEDNKALFEVIYTQTEDLENSWDYVTRCMAGVFGFIGAAVACLINPAAALLLVPIGAAVGSAVGWGLGILVLRVARARHEEEPKAETLPWTMRVTSGANVGSIIGGIFGLAIGFIGFIFTGPASIILAVSFFGAIGAIIGAVCGALWDKTSRALIWDCIKSIFVTLPPPEPQKEDKPPKMKRSPSDDDLLSNTSRPSSPINTMGSTAKTNTFFPVTPKPKKDDPVANSNTSTPNSSSKGRNSISQQSIYSNSSRSSTPVTPVIIDRDPCLLSHPMVLVGG